MKTISKIIFTCVFLFVSLLILSEPSGVNAKMVVPTEEEGSWGGMSPSYTNPTPPAEPPSEISLNADLNKTTFAPGEKIILSWSASRTACENNVKYLKIQGYIVKPVAEGDESYIIYDSNLAGGQSLPIGYKEYKAPLTAGNYHLQVKATTFSPEYYFTEVPDKDGNSAFISAYYIDSGRTDDLVDKIPQIGYYYIPAHGGYPYGSFGGPDGKEYAIGKDPVGEIPLVNNEFGLNFTVTAPASVDVKVDTVDGPITKNTGSDVAVTWTSTNATSCICQCQDLSGNAINCGGVNTTPPTKSNCGNANPKLNIGPDVKSNPITITNILQPTTFKVTCN